MNTILHERQLEEYYCTLCYAVFDFKRRTVRPGQFRPAVSDSLSAGAATSDGTGRRCAADRAAGRAARLVCRLVLRRGRASTWRRAISSCSAATASSRRSDAAGTEFGADAADGGGRAETVRRRRASIVDAIFAAVQEFRGDAPPNDDMTAVADQDHA